MLKIVPFFGLKVMFLTQKRAVQEKSTSGLAWAFFSLNLSFHLQTNPYILPHDFQAAWERLSAAIF